MKLVIDIPEKMYNKINTGLYDYGDMNIIIQNGIQLPKGHSFIAICDSDFPITEKVKQELKDTVFVGNEDCSYCFDIEEIIEADNAESESEK